jgi:hypothetical protein
LAAVRGIGEQPCEIDRHSHPKSHDRPRNRPCLAAQGSKCRRHDIGDMAGAGFVNRELGFCQHPTAERPDEQIALAEAEFAPRRESPIRVHLQR